MAETCPCGCGRKVPFMRGGAAKGARSMRELLVLLEDGTVDRFPPEHRGEVEQFISTGHELENWFLEHVHKTATPTRTPDLLALSRQLRAYLEAAAKILSV